MIEDLLLMTEYYFPNVEAGWKAQYERTLDRCIHGVGCKRSKTCRGWFNSFTYYFSVWCNLTPLTACCQGKITVKIACHE